MSTLNAHYLDLKYHSAGKESTCNAGGLGSIPDLGRSPAEGKGYPLQYSDLENSMDCIVQGVTKSGMTDFHFQVMICIIRFSLRNIKNHVDHVI